MEVVIDGIEYVPKEQKEEPRQIDWSKVASHVPVRVWDCDEDNKDMGFLNNYRPGNVSPFLLLFGAAWRHADLLTDLWVPHISDECPLPDGVMVEAVLRDGGEISRPAKLIRWSFTGTGGDIIRFRVTGLAEGWRW